MPSRESRPAGRPVGGAPRGAHPRPDEAAAADAVPRHQRPVGGRARGRHGVRGGLRRRLVDPRSRGDPGGARGPHPDHRHPAAADRRADRQGRRHALAGEGRPKRFSRQFAVFARGGSVKVTDDRLADVLFLADNPAWTWRDLQETPEDVLALLRQLRRAEARAREEAAK